MANRGHPETVRQLALRRYGNSNVTVGGALNSLSRVNHFVINIGHFDMPTVRDMNYLYYQKRAEGAKEALEIYMKECARLGLKEDS